MNSNHFSVYIILFMTLS